MVYMVRAMFKISARSNIWHGAADGKRLVHCSFGGSFTPGAAPVRLTAWMVCSEIGVVILMWTMIAKAGTGN